MCEQKKGAVVTIYRHDEKIFAANLRYILLTYFYSFIITIIDVLFLPLYGEIKDFATTHICLKTLSKIKITSVKIFQQSRCFAPQTRFS